MCGIVVVASRAQDPGRDSVIATRMRDLLTHRGPDDASIENVDGWITLGHRRLSIIDLEGARQPLRSEDGKVVTIFNGEIYNYKALRKQLVDRGHVFKTAGDGEVIVHGYEEWGIDVFARIEGMFAIVLADRRRNALLLVRDRFGIKPLYYTFDGSTLLAASELKALTGAVSTPRASRVALALGAMRMHVPWPLTAFENFYQLPPGALLEQQRDGKPQLRRILRWSAAPTTANEASPDATREVLRAAVGKQMVADVPVGAFLSGGIDSTIVTSLMREVTGGEIHTFSIKTSVEDESRVAANTSRVLGTTHHTIELDEITFDDLRELTAMFDEPFAETSAIGVRALSRRAREYVKVVLSGDGGDEVFGGYLSYRLIRALSFGPSRLPGSAAVAQSAHALLQRRHWPPLARRVLRSTLLANPDASTAQRDMTTLSWAASDEMRQLSEDLSGEIERAARPHDAADEPVRQAMLADRLERLPNAMLRKVDVASMNASLEVRVPLLDDEVVRHADTLPTKALMNLRFGKILLRRVLEGMPAGEIAWARKRGFSLPLEQWMQNPALARQLDALFHEQAIALTELTGEDVVALWQSFRSGDSRFSQGTAAMQLLWFASVALWADRFGIRSASDEPLATAAIV